MSAMYNKGPGLKRRPGDICAECGVKWHNTDMCWQVVGYSKWHPEHKKMINDKEKEGGMGGSGTSLFKLRG